jgi:hypothetical protein
VSVVTRDGESGALDESDREVCFNGICGATGGYPFEPVTLAELAAVARNQPIEIGSLRRAARWLRSKVGNWREPRDPYSASRLELAGWGVIFPSGADPSIRQALRPLLDWRRSGAATVDERRYRELWGPSGYRPGDSMRDFLLRHKTELGAADPERLPYYLLLIGGPEEIPFSFQYDLDLRHAVGRLDLETPEEYAAYAASVIAAEKAWGAPPLALDTAPVRRAVFFCPRNTDPMSGRMRKELVGNLLDRLSVKPVPGWELQPVLEEQASREALQQLLGGQGRPAFLFAACHGLVFGAADERQREKQGALLCQARAGALPLDAAVAASDIADDACPHGLIAMHFACYGAGTPARDEFSREHRAIAPRPFTARLPQRLLGHPRGGALAVVGHLERAWSYSFTGYGKAPQLNTFEDLIRRLLRGLPVGFALELLNCRYQQLAAELFGMREREELEPTDRVEDSVLAAVYCATRDARNYVVLGDPAARLLPDVAAQPEQAA